MPTRDAEGIAVERRLQNEREYVILRMVIFGDNRV
jgi:hypothetical protein